MIKEIVSDVMNFRLFKLLTSHILVEIKNAHVMTVFSCQKKINHVTFSPRSGVREEGVPGSG